MSATCKICGAQNAEFAISDNPYDDPVVYVCERCVRGIAPEEMAQRDAAAKALDDRCAVMTLALRQLREAQTRVERKAALARVRELGY